MLRLMMLALFAAALAGCATASVPLDPSVMQAAPGTAVLIIQRDTSAMPVAALPAAVFLDGKPVGSVENGRVLNMHVAVGRHSVGVAPIGRVAPKAPASEITVDVQADKPPVLRVHYVAAGWGGIEIERMKS